MNNDDSSLIATVFYSITGSINISGVMM